LDGFCLPQWQTCFQPRNDYMNFFQKNLSHEVEDRNNQDLLTQIGTFAYVMFALSISSLYLKFYISATSIQIIAIIIGCAFDPTCSSSE
jgi:hypothetical protein